MVGPGFAELSPHNLPAEARRVLQRLARDAGRTTSGQDICRKRRGGTNFKVRIKRYLTNADCSLLRSSLRQTIEYFSVRAKYNLRTEQSLDDYWCLSSNDTKGSTIIFVRCWSDVRKMIGAKRQKTIHSRTLIMIIFSADPSWEVFEFFVSVLYGTRGTGS